MIDLIQKILDKIKDHNRNAMIFKIKRDIEKVVSKKGKETIELKNLRIADLKIQIFILRVEIVLLELKQKEKSFKETKKKIQSEKISETFSKNGVSILG